MHPYKQRIRKPGDEISSGSDIFKILGYTDVCNPIYSFDLMNDSNFGRLKNCIENKIPIPESYNANIIRLRDYRLGSMINDFRDLCNYCLTSYEESWQEYRAEYNTSIPEEFYSFWMLCDDILLDKVLPKFVNLIDPISMEWIDPEYPKVTKKDGAYQFQLDAPIMTSNPLFLLPETEIEYFFHKPDCHPFVILDEEISEAVGKYIPDWLMKLDSMHEELTYSEELPGETKEARVSRIKTEIRSYSKIRK